MVAHTDCYVSELKIKTKQNRHKQLYKYQKTLHYSNVTIETGSTTHMLKLNVPSFRLSGDWRGMT